MARPSKPVSVLKAEGKAHRTKKELKIREEGEKAFATGINIKESDAVKNNVIAHNEFKRVVKLFGIIEKDDAIFQQVINRYCLLFAECHAMELKFQNLDAAIELLTESFEEGKGGVSGKEMLEYVTNFSREIAKLLSLQMTMDKQLQVKRKMMLDIEKENIMTIASALRNVPKKEENKTNPLLEALNG